MNHCASRITSHRNQHVQHDLTQSTQSNTIPSHHNPHNPTPLHSPPTTLKSPFVCSGGSGVNPARERVPPYNPAGIPCTQRHNAHPQSHAHHDTRYYTATHSTMSAAILRTATHAERNSYTAHDRPRHTDTIRRRSAHQSATNVALLLRNCATTPHTASQDNRRQAARPHTFTACISSLHAYSRTRAYSQITHNTPNARLYITPGSLGITGIAAHKNSLRRKTKFHFRFGGRKASNCKGFRLCI